MCVCVSELSQVICSYVGVSEILFVIQSSKVCIQQGPNVYEGNPFISCRFSVLVLTLEANVKSVVIPYFQFESQVVLFIIHFFEKVKTANIFF